MKNAIWWLGKRLLGDDKQSGFTKHLLMPLLFLASIKDYIHRCTTNEKLFVIPEDVRSKSRKTKYILVLDLDQTLIYSRNPSPPNHPNFFTIPNSDGGVIYVQPRPHVHEFLSACAEVFTLYVYTAGRKHYADAILDVLDTQRLIQKRFYRDSCVSRARGMVKNLKKLPKNGDQPMFLLDDNPDSIKLNAPYGIIIVPFEGDQSDRELSRVFSQLIDLYH